MKIPKIANAIGYIDNDLIAASCKENKKYSNLWLKWGSFAACLAVVVIIGAAILPKIFTTPDNADDRYNDIHIQAGESGIVWPWEYLAVYEKYTELKLGSVNYRSHGRAVSDELVGKLIGTHTVVGWDVVTNDKYSEDFEVYELKYADKSQIVAVKMEGTCYVFKNDKYDPPSTLGKLFELVDLSKAIELRNFSENGDAQSRKHFTLNNDDRVWEILSGCKNAKFVEDDKWKIHNREYLSFTVTSETLGVYKVAMYVTADGYLWTNAFNYQYLFNIGKEAAGKIIKYAKENSTKAELEAYRYTVSGKIVEITKDHILVDDYILCKEPADSITYKILLSDIRISRYVDLGVVDVGDIVVVSYEEGINNNTVDSAVSISKGIISGGDLLIPE